MIFSDDIFRTLRSSSICKALLSLLKGHGPKGIKKKPKELVRPLFNGDEGDISDILPDSL